MSDMHGPKPDESSTGSVTAPETWMLEDLHKLRAYADMRGMTETKEALRIAIIHTALELGTPTGLSILELAYGLTPMPPDAKRPS